MKFDANEGQKPVSTDVAERLALSGFIRLAQDDELLMRFADLTGVLPNDMRAIANEPHFLVAVLDFYLGYEPDLIAWAQADGFGPDEVAKARFALAPDDSSGF